MSMAAAYSMMKPVSLTSTTNTVMFSLQTTKKIGIVVHGSPERGTQHAKRLSPEPPAAACTYAYALATPPQHAACTAGSSIRFQESTQATAGCSHRHHNI